MFEPKVLYKENTSKNSTKTSTEQSTNHYKVLENFNEKILEIKYDKGVIAPYIASFPVNLFKTET